MLIHVVSPGESIYSIARRYGVAPGQIIADNGITNPDRLAVGQALIILTDSVPHTVRGGQSLYSIARAYRVPLAELIAANPDIPPSGRIVPGQVIRVPVPSRTFGTIDVNGYVFPNVNTTVLQNSLAYLTYLSIFSHEVRPDGSLSQINDTPLITAARNANVLPLMVITNIEEGGSFSSELAATILGSAEIQTGLINNVVAMLRQKNYAGLDIDFEYIPPEYRDEYNSFVQRVAETIRPMGYTLTTALAPKISADQPGLLYEAHDYEAHGRLADHVILMTYEWGYTYGPPRAVAPVNEIRRVLDYAVTAIPPEKILMGIPNYGYDWTLPYVPGSAARVISNTAAPELAARMGAVIQYDTRAQAPYFNYTDENGTRHVVWFEDARSLRAKMRLVSEYGLGGVSYWTLNRYFPQLFLVQDAMFDVRKG